MLYSGFSSPGKTAHAINGWFGQKHWYYFFEPLSHYERVTSKYAAALPFNRVFNTFQLWLWGTSVEHRSMLPRALHMLTYPSVGIDWNWVSCQWTGGDTPDGNLCELRFASPPTVPAPAVIAGHSYEWKSSDAGKREAPQGTGQACPSRLSVDFGRRPMNN